MSKSKPEEGAEQLPVWSGREARWWRAPAVLLLLLCTWIAYGGNLRHGFHFDDGGAITNNPALQTLRNRTKLGSRPGESKLKRARRAMRQLPAQAKALYEFNPYRMVTYWTFALQEWAHGVRGKRPQDDPFTDRPHPAVRAVNDLIHAANGLLVFWLVYLTLTAPAFARTRSACRYPTVVALLAALIFTLHPMQTQAVTYLSQRAESLCATFYLLSMICYVQARLRSLGDAQGSAPWLTALVLGAGGLLVAASVVLARLTDILGIGGLVKLTGFAAVGTLAGVVAVVKTGRDDWRHALLTVGCFASFALALQSKEIAVTLPFAICLWDLLFIPGERSGGTPRQAWLLRAVRGSGLARLRYLGPWAAIVASALVLGPLYGGFNFSSKLLTTVEEGGRQSASLGAGEYFLTQANVLHTYIRSYALPTALHLDYDYPRALSGAGTIATTVISLLGLLAALGLVIWRGGRARVGAFALLFGLAILAPTSSFIVLPDLIYEHRFYLPLAGLALLTAVALDRVARRFLEPKQHLQALLGLGLALAIGLTLATRSRNAVWETDLTLWKDTTAKDPGKPRGWTNLGLAYQNREPMQIKHPGNRVSWGVLRTLPGGVHLLVHTSQLTKKPLPFQDDFIVSKKELPGGLEKAREAYARALELDPNYAKALNNLALVAAYERHNLVLENHFIRYDYLPKLAKIRRQDLIEACQRRIELNTHRANLLFDEAVEAFMRQWRNGVKNFFLCSNLGNLYWQRAQLEMRTDLKAARRTIEQAMHWVERATYDADAPASTFAVLAEQQKARGDVQWLLARQDPKTAAEPVQAGHYWYHAIRNYERYLKTAPGGAFTNRVRSALEQTRAFKAGKAQPQRPDPSLPIGAAPRRARPAPRRRRGPPRGRPRRQ